MLYRDTDQMGVVYYGNFFTFFEAGRTELMRSLGMPYSAMEKGGYFLVVSESYAKYLANVTYDDEMIIKTRVADVGSVRIRFEYEIYDVKGKLLTTGFTVHACVDEKSKVARIPAAFKELLSEVCGK